MYTDMPIVDRGATATSGIRAQNAIRFLLGSSVRSALIPDPFCFTFPKCSSLHDPHEGSLEHAPDVGDCTDWAREDEGKKW